MIGILITLCSKNQEWNELHNCDLLQQFLDSFFYTISNKNDYTFYIGYDENDKWFSERCDQLKQRLSKAKIFSLPKRCNGNPCEAWNILYKKAYDDNCDYFYQVGSDIVHLVNNWDEYFIKIMRKNDNDCIVGGVEQNYWCERVIRDQSGILENVFLSRKHYDRFGFLFPPEVKTWFSDDMITKIYRNVDKCFVCPNIKFTNGNRVGGHNDKSRYVPPENTPIAKSWFIHANNYTVKGFPEIDKNLYLKKPVYN
jgi:hypothetical protein